MSAIKIFKPTFQSFIEIKSSNIATEKQLQNLFEANLDSLLDVRLLETEFSIDGGRIDTLGLDMKNRPVVIEYKRNFDEKIINQGVKYVRSLDKNKRAFAHLVMEKMKEKAPKSINWPTRLICVAENFSSLAVDTTKEFRCEIELIRYLNFSNDLLMLEFMLETPRRKSIRPKPLEMERPQLSHKSRKDNDAMISELTGKMKGHYEALTDFLQRLGADVQEDPLKQYMAFKRNERNFACVKVLKSKLLVYVRLNPDKTELIKGFTRDMRNIPHHGTGDLELTITSDRDFEQAKPLIKKSYEAS